MAGPLISFLTDFGGESAPATCRGVMWGIAPDARLLDLNHQVPKFVVRDGAFLLSRAVGYLPVGVHLAVVDPGVGTGTPARRPAGRPRRPPRRAGQRVDAAGGADARWRELSALVKSSSDTAIPPTTASM
jgi:hypothetical protein